MTTALPISTETSRPEPTTESRLLYGAYDRMRLNIVLTTSVTVIFGALLWPFFPSLPMTLWVAAILVMAVVGQVLWVAFQRAQPPAHELGRWQKLYLAQVAMAGTAWALGPVLMLPQASGIEMALFIAILTCVCVVAMTSMSEQQVAVQAFIAATLLPPAVVIACIGGGIERLVALVLVCGMALMMVVGRLFNQSMRDLLGTQSRMRTILDTAQDAIIEVDGTGRITDWNQRAETMFGWAKAEVLGQDIADKIIPEPQREAHRMGMARFLTTGEKRIINRRLEFTALHREGWEFPIELAISPLKTGDTWHFTAFIVDITQRKQAEAERWISVTELVVAREAAERANQAKSDFLSSMSHELRTPMNAILGFAQMLEYDSNLNADQQDNVHEILKGGRHLLELINEVLDLAKIESGHVDLSLEPLELSGLVEDCRLLIQPLAAARWISLSLEVPLQTTVRGDRVRLKQVVLNLLSNAVKYNREGGDIRLGVNAVAGNRLRISVTDTGPGIAPDRMAELFQPFSRLNAENSGIEGTGIGLTITRRLVELMDGEIGVDSQVGVGSTFWIELPSDAAEASAVVAAGSGAAHPITAAMRRHRVLCIDDNPVNLKLIALMLGKHRNVHLITAHTPELGIEFALAHRPDLILLDINMPGMDGYQVLEVFKSDARLKAIPVIAVTANAMPRDIERGRTAGFADYLTKPLNLAIFLQAVDHCLTDMKETVS